MQRGELMTGTPRRARRWRASTRKMTCSREPAGMARTTAAAHSSRARPWSESANDPPRQKVVDRHLGRAEQHLVDLVELTVVPLENIIEGNSVIGGGRCGEAVGDRRDLLVARPDGEVDAGSVEDAVVRPPDAPQVVLGHRGDRTEAGPAPDL